MSNEPKDCLYDNIVAILTFELQRLAFIFKGADGLHWSSHLEQYLARISQHSTLSQDKILIAQVKVQLIINQIHNAPWQATFFAPPTLYLSALHSQLNDIMANEGAIATVENYRKSDSGLRAKRMN